MNRITTHILLTALTLLILTVPQLRAEVANPDKHPYASTAGGRENYKLSNHKVNEARLYDFYARQADYYMQQSEVPRLLPAFPGLDAAKHGHWGKHNQNNHLDDRWNEMDVGSIIAGRLHVGKRQLHKAFNIRLGDNNELSACFDGASLTYPSVWGKDFIKFHPFRWGVSRGAHQQGPSIFSHSGHWHAKDENENKLITPRRFLGTYRNGKKLVFAYQLGQATILDHPWVTNANGHLIFTRTLSIDHSKQDQVKIPITQLPPQAKPSDIRAIATQNASIAIQQYTHGNDIYIICHRVLNPTENETSVTTGHMGMLDLNITSKAKESQVELSIWHGTAVNSKPILKHLSKDTQLTDVKALTKPGKPQWPQTFTVKGNLADNNGPYVIDTIPIPFDNPWKSMMMMSGIDFLSDGRALVCTLMGDVWLVSGLDSKLEKVTWKRFAAGLSQPFGIKITNDVIYVLGKDQLNILHDYNKDGEADFIENYSNAYLEDHGHTHVFGLDHDREGNFYFTCYEKLYKLEAGTRNLKLIAKGFRNCMGLAASYDGIVLAANQEGTWTPASAITEVKQGEHYGHLRRNEPIASAMTYIPRGIDNSTGGMVFVNDDRFGPLGNGILGLSYGYGSWYNILRDASGSRAQGAIVPLKGEFESGVVRGRINPKDGQFYTVGTDGWGNYALKDGCFARIRYTGKPFHQPTGIKVHYNGLRIDFPEPLDAASAKDIKNYFCQQWNYEYSKRYGSPEFSVYEPGKLGHDLVDITNVDISKDKKTIFLEIPNLYPVMQMHIRMHLMSAKGNAFKADIFPSILELGSVYQFEGAKELIEGKPKKIKLRIRNEKAQVAQKKPQKVDREFTLSGAPGLKFDKTELTAKPGETISITLKNTDGMPHNFVLVQPGAYEKVGQASFKMLNDPQAFDKHYVPELKEVLGNTPVVFPGKTTTVYIKLPDTPGNYPYMCTFPGHWEAMKGMLIVK